MCLSLDSLASKIRFVVDGQLLREAEYEKEMDINRPDDLSLVLGRYPTLSYEITGKTADLNIFSSALSVEGMQSMTMAGQRECGAPGDFLSWEKAEWALQSKAKIVEVERKTGGPCRQESRFHVYTATFENHYDCMHHCQKIAGGRSPPVSTLDDWENFTREIDLITPDRSKLPWMWLSATEGDVGNHLGKLPHWPEHETVNNVTLKLDAEERVWRDYYTGLRLENWIKPYYSSKKDEISDDTYNCMEVYSDKAWNISWFEWECYDSFQASCPCQYPTQPILRLRGLCRKTSIDTLFTLKQMPVSPDTMVILGQKNTQIMYDKTANHLEAQQ